MLVQWQGSRLLCGSAGFNSRDEYLILVECLNCRYKTGTGSKRSEQGNFIEGNLLQTLYSLRKVCVNFIWYICIPVLLNLIESFKKKAGLLSSTQFYTLVLSWLRDWVTWVILLRRKWKKQQSNKIRRSRRPGVFLRWRYPVSELFVWKIKVRE